MYGRFDACDAPSGDSMRSTPRLADVAVGDKLPSHTFDITRRDLVMYAGASGDFNPIHWSDRAAGAANLPTVIAHGMLTMGRCACLVVEWAGDPAAVLEYKVRFLRTIAVPDDGKATIEVKATVTEILDNRRVRIGLDASQTGQLVLGHVEFIVRLK
jgi:acyl dehydratase